ncbi:HET-domain-containing protein, partial [Setomelanomma holmii]
MSALLNRLHLYDSYPIPPDLRCIRVLRVHAPHTNEGEIKCDMTVVHLDSNTPFTALSYVWGSPECSDRSLRCGHASLPVTLNCHSALWHLRKKLGSFCIWVDSVCIDQTNAQEKVQQIALMKEIYRKAEHVYVWLGPGSPATQRAVSPFRYWRITRSTSIVSMEDIENLLDATWTQRIWTYQEIVLASRPVL